MKEIIIDISEKLKKNEINVSEAINLLLLSFGNNNQIIDIESMITVIKTMPAGQAIQSIKSKITGTPYTKKTDGMLVVTYINYENIT